MTDGMDDERWIHEAERLYGRYQREIVEACGLCPWALKSRTDGRFRTRVLLATDPRDKASVLAILDELDLEPRTEVAVLVFPRLPLGRLAFERFVGELRDADSPRHPIGCIPFVFAAFHPDASPDATDAERMIPFLRRTPDPTIQILRTDVLDRVRSSTPQGTQFIDMRSLEALDVDTKEEEVSLRQRIARTNLATVERIGIAEMTRRLDVIVADRKATYSELESAAAAAKSRELRLPG
jgi:hypothetical protein